MSTDKKGADGAGAEAETPAKVSDEQENEENKPKPSLLESTTSNASTSDWLREYLSVAMGLTTFESRLDEVSFEGIARYIQSDKCQKIVTLAGAGISTSAGIPDFRSPGTGVYDRLKDIPDLPDPSQVFQLDYFKERPDIVYSLRKELMTGTYKPTPCHYFVKMLHDKSKLFRHFTQNIDGLELEAGMDPDSLVQAHGTCQSFHCMECEKTYTKDYMADVLADDTLKVPKCEKKGCDGVIRPDIVFFGESLPKRFGERVDDIKECDMMIIMGTSLVVQPFASLTSMARPDVPRLYINLENTGNTNVHPLSALIFGGGFDFEKEENIRDIYWQGKCDDGCYALADLIGWGAELRELVKTEHAKIDKKLAEMSKRSQKPSTSGASATKSVTKHEPNKSRSVHVPTKVPANQASKQGAKPTDSSTKATATGRSKPSTSSRPVSVSKPSPGARPKTLTGTKPTPKK